MTRVVNRLLRLSLFPLVFQLLTLAFFILLIVLGIFANTDDMAFAKVLRNTNLANLLVWSYWWPLLVISAIVLGRVWCAVCPMELMTSLAARVGLKRTPPRFLRSGWGITLFYVLVLFVGIQTLAIHRVPFRMAIYMLILFLTATATGLLFSRNTFCAHVCPVGYLLGLYARLAPFRWGVQHSSLCVECSDKSCIAPKNAYAFLGRSCGVGLHPAKPMDNAQCLLCGQCLKACDRNNPGLDKRPNPGWFSRPWFSDLLALKPLSAAQAAFVVVVSGFVVYELYTEWHVTKGLLLWLPTHVGQILAIRGTWAHGLIKSLTLFVALPAAFWLLPYGAVRLVRGHLPLNDYLLRFGIAFIPIMAAAHAIKSLLKISSRIPYWEHVVADPIGITAARSIIDGTAALAANPGWLDAVLTWVSLPLMGCAVILSAYVMRRLILAHLPHSGWRSLPLYVIPALYGGGFLAMLIAWRLA